MNFDFNEFSMKSFDKLNLKKEFIQDSKRLFQKIEKDYMKIEKHPGYVAFIDLEKNIDSMPSFLVETKIFLTKYEKKWDKGWNIFPAFHSVMDNKDEFGVEFVSLREYKDDIISSYNIYYANGTYLRIY